MGRRVSYSTIKALWPGEKQEDLETLRNSWGSAPVVWDALCQKYLGAAPHGFLNADLDRLWRLWEDATIPLYYRSVLMMTFDRAYVTKKDYTRAAQDIRSFLADFPQKPSYANNWPRIADVFESDPDIPAIGIRHTSVSEDPFQGGWNEETDSPEPLDWSTCYDLYEMLDGLGVQGK